MSLSESHTRETALRTRVFVCLIACLHFKYLPKIKIVFVHLNPVGEVLMPGHSVSVKETQSQVDTRMVDFCFDTFRP